MRMKKLCHYKALARRNLLRRTRSGSSRLCICVFGVGAVIFLLLWNSVSIETSNSRISKITELFLRDAKSFLRQFKDGIIRSKTKEINQKRNQTRIIVDWTTFYGTSLVSYARVPMSHCPVKCTFTNNRTLVQTADAVLFHLRDTNPSSVPKIRHPFQRYVFLLMEPPTLSGGAIGPLSKHFFNWTMTYRLDSDIQMFYDQFIPLNATPFDSTPRSTYSWNQVLNITAMKTKMVAQFVSRCQSSSSREKYLDELAKHITVDVFGSCSKKKCKTRQNEECDKMLTKEYRFYLSFENSICLDYVTEKFWRLKGLIVPIVLRGSDYERIAPKGSYISADQFKSPKDLAVHLTYLANNQIEYLKYFEWTKEYFYSNEMWRSLCDLCQALHSDFQVPKSYDNIEKWWFERGSCQNNFALLLLGRNVSMTMSSTTKASQITTTKTLYISSTSATTTTTTPEQK